MLFLKHCAVGHVPKCAGRFVRKCLVSSNTTFSRDLPDKHGAHLTPDVDDNMGVIFFVRHPYTWLRSLHAHRSRKGWNWDNRYEMEKVCQSHSFPKFIKNVCSHEDILFRYFEEYFGKYRNQELKIGKVENITEDLIGFLHHFEEEFDESIIRSTGVHMNNPAAKNLSIGDHLIKELYKSQGKFYSEHNYSEGAVSA